MIKIPAKNAQTSAIKNMITMPRIKRGNPSTKRNFNKIGLCYCRYKCVPLLNPTLLSWSMPLLLKILVSLACSWYSYGPKNREILF